MRLFDGGFFRRRWQALLCAALLALAPGCGKNPGNDSAMTPQDLAQRHFSLVSFDGKDFSAREPAPSIDFDERLHISGAVCNRFRGQGHLNGNVLTATQLVFTRMLCADQALNELENLLAQMLASGAELRLTGQHLVLRQGGHELRYKLGGQTR